MTQYLAARARRILAWWFGLFTMFNIICWFVGAMIGTVGMATYFYWRPPGTLLSIAEDAEFSVSGDGLLMLVVHADRHRYCPGANNRWLQRPIMYGGQPMSLYRFIGNIPAPPTGLGDQKYAIELDIPAHWDKPGVAYTAKSDPNCGLFPALLNPPSIISGPFPIDMAGK